MPITPQDLRDVMNAGRLPGCRLCGLLGPEGCRHTLSHYQALTITAPAYLFSTFATKPAPVPLSLPISSTTGLPIRHRS